MKRALAVAGLCLVAANQRPALASVSPLLDRIGAELGLTGAQAGALATLPLIMMGLGAPLASAGARRLPVELIMLGGLVLIAIGCALRWIDGGFGLLLVTAALAGLGISFIGTLMPSLISSRGSVESLTGATTFALALGAVVASAVAVPLADQIGWRASLAVWAALALVAAVPLLAVSGRSMRTARPAASRGPAVWLDRTAWMLAAYFAIQTLHFYTALTWIPSTFAAAGFSPRASGLLLTAMAFGNMVGAFSAPLIMRAAGTARTAGATILMSFATTGLMAINPGFAPALVMLLLGVSLGGGFGICLTLLVWLADGPAASASLAGMASLVAYTVGALGPLVVGIVSDEWGFRWAWALVMGLCVAQLALLPVFAESRHGSIGRDRAVREPMGS